VYRGAREPEKNLGIFALYVAYFPQLVSGPIERPGNLLPQFRQPIAFDYDRITSGLKLMLWGMFKKVVVADNLAVFVNRVYTHPTNYQGVSLIAATVFFAFQIYCDFSGYTDIAIGAAQVMGHKLMENFKRPYFSKSIGEFWRRWHISLSSWFRDYLYIPLGGNRVSVPRWYFNLFIVFLLSGLWHGANWTFLIWGGLHGFYLVSSIAMQPWRAAVAKMVGLERVPTLHKCLQVGVTFALVCFSWIFFRANSLSDAFYIVSHLFSGWDALLDFQKFKYAVSMGLGLRNLMLPVLGVAFMETAHLVQRKGSVRRLMVQTPFWVRWPAYVCLALAIMNLGVPYEIPFIYFQF
jgi:D-alanyl-lipoteichoic acid acyltransferase DltB (MBOAT superfamily)